MTSCLRACAHLISQDFAIAVRHIPTLAIADGFKFGMVVTPNGHYMVVSYISDHKLRVYRIEAGGMLTLLHTFEGESAGLKAPALIASTAWARTSSAQACDNVSVSLLYSVLVTASLLAGMMC